MRIWCYIFKSHDSHATTLPLITFFPSGDNAIAFTLHYPSRQFSICFRSVLAAESTTMLLLEQERAQDFSLGRMYLSVHSRASALGGRASNQPSLHTAWNSGHRINLQEKRIGSEFSYLNTTGVNGWPEIMHYVGHTLPDQLGRQEHPFWTRTT